MIYMPVYFTKFLAFSEMNKSKPLIIQNGLCLNMQYNRQYKNHKKMILKARKSLPSLTLPPTKNAIVRNGVWIGKLEKEVLPH